MCGTVQVEARRSDAGLASEPLGKSVRPSHVALNSVAIIAGEASGDQLGADLIEALRRKNPSIDVFGMAGPRMRAAGCDALAEMEALNVMGLVEVVRHYPRLRALRGRLSRQILARRPDVVIGIDVPDFALWIERQAKHAGHLAVHYVCPQVWAWRAGRLPAIRLAVDLILALFPFEVPFLAKHGISASFVGHPLADRIPQVPDRVACRHSLGLDPEAPLIALMPGSRRQELARLADLFLSAAAVLARRRPDVRFVAGAVSAGATEFLRARQQEIAPGLPLAIIERQASEALMAADAALVASGTITLEAALCGTPSVVAYRLAPLTYWWLSRRVKVPHVALPNLLLSQRLFPEFLQEAATPEVLAMALEARLDDPKAVARCRRTLTALHAELAQGAGERAAQAILDALVARS